MSAETDPLTRVLDRMDELLAAVDAMPSADRRIVLELLDRVDDLHRLALTHLGAHIAPSEAERLRATHPSVEWLFDAYQVGQGEVARAERALDPIRPYLDSHGGAVEVVDVRDGIVRVRLAGACAGCTGSAITLQAGVEEALADGFVGYAGLEVEEDDAAPHAPPGETLLQIQWRTGTGPSSA